MCIWGVGRQGSQAGPAGLSPRTPGPGSVAYIYKPFSPSLPFMFQGGGVFFGMLTGWGGKLRSGVLGFQGCFGWWGVVVFSGVFGDMGCGFAVGVLFALNCLMYVCT